MNPDGTAPPGRPTWSVVLSFLMLLFGAQFLFSGLSTLKGSGVQLAGDLGAPRMDSTAPEDVMIRQIAVASTGVDKAFPRVVRAHAAARVVLALVMLFAVAGVMTTDPRARVAAMAAAWSGIAYNVANALFFVFVVRERILALAPSWVDTVLRGNSNVDNLTTDDLMGLANVLTIAVPFAVAVVGIGFNLLVLRFFGGRRGREFYGGEPPEAQRLPDHGG